MSIMDFLESKTVGMALWFSFSIAIIFGAITLLIIYFKSKKNAKKPIQTASVKVISKRNISIVSPKAGYYILFEFDLGFRHEFPVTTSEAAAIIENDIGVLTYQGTKFIRFERNVNK